MYIEEYISECTMTDDSPSTSELAFRVEQIKMIGYYNHLDNTSIIVDMNYTGDSYITTLLPRLKSLMRESKINKLLI